MVNLYLAYVALLGAALGSFLNVVIFRYNTGRGIQGRSFCTSCGKKLLWHELVPVLSFLFLRGRCRTCRARISWQYPFVELFTAVAVALSFAGFLQSPPVLERWFVLLAQVFSWPLLIVMFVYDLRHKIIPDAFVYSFIAVALAFRIAMSFLSGFTSDTWLDLAIGPILFLAFFSLWYFSKGRSMGLGDGKLALGMGLLLGFSGGISAVIFGFLAGAIVGIFIMAFQRFQKRARRLTMKSEIPFGPFLVSGVFAVLFCDFSIFTFFSWA